MSRSKRGGQPKSDDPRGGTKLTRVYDDIHFMIYWITEATSQSSAELLDPMIRAGLTSRFVHVFPAIELLAKTRGQDVRELMGGIGLQINVVDPSKTDEAGRPSSETLGRKKR